MKHWRQHQVLLSYQGWLNQEIFHVQRVEDRRKREGLTEDAEVRNLGESYG